MKDAAEEPESGYEVKWYRKDDITHIIYYGYITNVVLNESLDVLSRLLDSAQGDLAIYNICDQSRMTGYDPEFMTQVALHPVAFHPKGAKLYVVGSKGELLGMQLGFSQHRANLVRFADTLDDAVREIDARRAAYLARKSREQNR